MALALDIITVVVFIALISKGAAKGFLSALSELAGLIVSVAAAAVFCQPFGSFIYSHFLKDAVLRAAQSAAAAELAGVDSALAKLAGTYARGVRDGGERRPSYRARGSLRHNPYSLPYCRGTYRACFSRR